MAAHDPNHRCRPAWLALGGLVTPAWCQATGHPSGWVIEWDIVAAVLAGLALFFVVLMYLLLDTLNKAVVRVEARLLSTRPMSRLEFPRPGGERRGGRGATGHATSSSLASGSKRARCRGVSP